MFVPIYARPATVSFDRIRRMSRFIPSSSIIFPTTNEPGLYLKAICRASQTDVFGHVVKTYVGVCSLLIDEVHRDQEGVYVRPGAF
jgi:hypothetical protein